MNKDRILFPTLRENCYIIHHLQPFGNIVLPLFSVLLILLVFPVVHHVLVEGNTTFRHVKMP